MAGKTENLTASSQTSRIAIQKAGIENPRAANTSIARSKIPRAFHAASNPRGMPMRRVRAPEMKAMLRVGSSRGFMRLVMECLLKTEVPRSPRNRLPTHVPNCTISGSSNPNAACSSLIRSIGVSSPTAATMGSPPAICITKKEMTATIPTTTKLARNRRATKLSTLQCPLGDRCRMQGIR